MDEVSVSIFATTVPVSNGLIADERAVASAIRLLLDPAHGLQLQGLPGGAYRIVPAGNLEAAMEAARSLSDLGGKGMYWNLNPIPAGLSSAAKNADVISRRWLLIDVDIDRADPETNTTDAEKEEARVVAENIREYLCAEKNWPGPVVVDSGNGWHLLFRVDLPNDESAKDLVTSVLHRIGDQFDAGNVKIDRKVRDARRISKLPGTWARKGPHSSERPHRIATILHAPEVTEIVTTEQLGEVAKLNRPSPEKRNGSTFVGVITNGNGSGLAWARRAIEIECARVSLAKPGPAEGRNNALFKAAANIGEIVAGGHVSEGEAERRLFEAAIGTGLTEQETRRTIRSGFDAGKKKPRGPKERPAPWLLTVPSKPVDGKLYTLPELLALQIPEHRWAVPGILSEGLTLLAGAPKQGKSWLALNLAITIAAGGVALGNTKVVPGDVLYLCLEDRLRRVQFRSKKILTGLNCIASGRLRIAVEWPRMDQGGMEKIAEWAKSVSHPTLVIIDVWQKFKPIATGGRSKNQYEEDYQFSTVLKSFSDNIGASTLAIHHTKKSKSEDWLEDVSGTLGLAGAADGVLVLQRARGQWEANLCMTGRDIDEKTLALKFNQETAVWTSEGTDEERTTSKVQTAIMAVMRGHPGAAWTPTQLADQTEMPAKHVRVNLGRMVDSGLIEKQNGQYRYPVQVRQTDSLGF